MAHQKFPVSTLAQLPSLLSPDLYEVIWCTEFGNECEMPAAIDMFIRVSHLLVCFNSSANFVVYYLNGEKFREFRRKAWRRRRRQWSLGLPRVTGIG